MREIAGPDCQRVRRSLHVPFDALDRQTEQISLDGSVTRYALDGLGLPVLVERSVNGSSLVTRLERDILGRLVRKETAEAYRNGDFKNYDIIRDSPVYKDGTLING